MRLGRCYAALIYIIKKLLFLDLCPVYKIFFRHVVRFRFVNVKPCGSSSGPICADGSNVNCWSVWDILNVLKEIGL
jgi:hypothetical protein